MMRMRRLRMMMRRMMRSLRRKEKIRDGGRLLLLATMLPGKLQLWSHGHWIYSGFLTRACNDEEQGDSGRIEISFEMVLT